MSVVADAVRDVSRQLRRDLRDDPFLAPILVGAFALAAFWFWHRTPNFATWDERDRLLDPLVTYSAVLEDPSLQSLRDGVAWGRAPFGATFYLYAVAIFPVVLLAVLVGDGGAIAAIYPPGWEYGHWEVWHETPAWIWTGAVAAARFVNVCLAVGSVYVTYRLGVAMRDRPTGRLAAALLAVSFGLLMLAHEAGEDVPALFTLLCSLYLLVRYVQTGSHRLFYASCALGGFAVAFKLTAGLIVPIIGLGFLLRVRRTERPLSSDARSTPLGSGLGFLAWLRSDDASALAAFWHPKLVGGGIAIGAAAIVLGFPTLLVGDVGAVWQRWFGQAANRASVVVGPTAPSWWWFLRAYFAAFGLPLAVALLVGVPAGIASLRSTGDRDAATVVAAALAVFLLVLTTWHDFRPHHLLPTFPLAVLLLAAALITLYERRPTVARPLVAVLLVTTTVFAGVGVAGYSSTPRAEATDWLATHAPANATLETYHHGFDETALPHDLDVSHRWGPETDADDITPHPRYIQLSYQDLLYLRDVPVDQRERDVDEGVEARAEYIRSLLDGEYAYEIAAEFGPRPPDFVPQRPDPGSLVDILPMGITPRNDFYGDEQEMGPTQYVVILERTGEVGNRTVPDWEGGV